MELSTTYVSHSARRAGAKRAGRGLMQPVPRGIKNPLANAIPIRLSHARDRQGLGAAELGRRAGLSRGAVGFIEDSIAVAKLDTLERISAALGVDPGWLAFGFQGYEPFRERRPREVLPLDYPEPAEPLRVFRKRHLGLPTRLREARERSGLSMRELSRAAGVSVTTWSNTEAGKTVPRVDICERMAVALDVAPTWLAYGYDHDEGSEQRAAR